MRRILPGALLIALLGMLAGCSLSSTNPYGAPTVTAQPSVASVAPSVAPSATTAASSAPVSSAPSAPATTAPSAAPSTSSAPAPSTAPPPTSAPASSGQPNGTRPAVLPPNFPLPPQYQTQTSVDDGRTIGVVLQVPSVQEAFDFYKGALPGAGYQVQEQGGVNVPGVSTVHGLILDGNGFLGTIGFVNNTVVISLTRK